MDWNWSLGGSNPFPAPFLSTSIVRTMVDLPSNTPVEDYTHILVYTVSNLVEQTTPVATNIEDAGLIVSEACVESTILNPSIAIL